MSAKLDGSSVDEKDCLGSHLDHGAVLITGRMSEFEQMISGRKLKPGVNGRLAAGKQPRPEAGLPCVLIAREQPCMLSRAVIAVTRPRESGAVSFSVAS